MFLDILFCVREKNLERMLWRREGFLLLFIIIFVGPWGLGTYKKRYTYN